MMIEFKQHLSSTYPPRTFENATADVTLAFAFNFETAGEKLTKIAARSQDKIYIQINPYFTSNDVWHFIEKLKKFQFKTINIAGNSLPTLQKHNCNQSKCDEIVYDFLRLALHNIKTIELIRSGGQSGFDEAGLKAAVKLGIPALCLCPKGWKFIDANGWTVCDEKKFKARFL